MLRLGGVLEVYGGGDMKGPALKSLIQPDVSLEHHDFMLKYDSHVNSLARCTENCRM